MNERRFDRIADAFMADGPTALADRVLDAAFAEVHLTRQRRVLWRVPRRFPNMNSLREVRRGGRGRHRGRVSRGDVSRAWRDGRRWTTERRPIRDVAPTATRSRHRRRAPVRARRP